MYENQLIVHGENSDFLITITYQDSFLVMDPYIYFFIVFLFFAVYIFTHILNHYYNFMDMLNYESENEDTKLNFHLFLKGKTINGITKKGFVVIEYKRFSYYSGNYDVGNITGWEEVGFWNSK